jgi:hypothetical protein
MSVNVNSIVDPTSFQFIDDQTSVLPENTTPTPFRHAMVALKSNPSAPGICFKLEYELTVNGSAVNLSFADENASVFERHHFDGFGAVEFVPSNPKNSTLKLTLVTESDGRIETFTYDGTSEEITPVCSCPFTSFAFMVEETGKSNRSPSRSISIQVKVYVFPKELRDRFIITPLNLPTRRFNIADGYAYAY